MTLQRLLILFVVLLVPAAGWRFRNTEPLRSLWSPGAQVAPAPIKFDNGTVRVYTAASQPAGTLADGSLPPGVMRKCVGPKSTTYSDQPCPGGTREASISKGSVNVVAGQTPAAGSGNGSDGASSPRKNLRDALVGEVPAQSLRDKAIEQTVNR